MAANAEASGRVGRIAPARAIAVNKDQIGTYLTDEVFLYRIVDVLVTQVGREMADLEDCYWLDIVRVPVAEMRAHRLRVVTPA